MATNELRLLRRETRSGHKLFYRRSVAEHNAMLVCLQCERETAMPSAAAHLAIVFEGGIVFVFCHRCGAKERLAT